MTVQCLVVLVTCVCYVWCVWPSMYMSCLSSPPCAGRDCLIDPLRSTIQAKVKANAVKQEHKKQEELKKSSLRAVAALLPTQVPHPVAALPTKTFCTI